MQFSLSNTKKINKVMGTLTDAEKLAKFLNFAKSEKMVVKFNGTPLNLSVSKILKNA